MIFSISVSILSPYLSKRSVKWSGVWAGILKISYISEWIPTLFFPPPFLQSLPLLGSEDKVEKTETNQI